MLCTASHGWLIKCSAKHWSLRSFQCCQLLHYSLFWAHAGCRSTTSQQWLHLIYVRRVSCSCSLIWPLLTGLGPASRCSRGPSQEGWVNPLSPSCTVRRAGANHNHRLLFACPSSAVAIKQAPGSVDQDRWALRCCT